MTPSDLQLVQSLLHGDLNEMMREARNLRDLGHGDVISYSRKVFVPLTQLCRDVCHYCTFSRVGGEERRAYLTQEEVLSIARAGVAAGCDEILFTLGDQPEHRWSIAREALQRVGHRSTLDYLHACCAAVLKEGGPLPHINAGLMSREEMTTLRDVSASMGLMLENVSERLMQPGQVHHGSYTKAPGARLAMIETAGELQIPFTSGILIGIGETRRERLDSLIALRDLHERHGHLQEVIVQNFRAKRGTPMADAQEPDFDDLAWTIAAARIILGSTMNIQAPPNLTSQEYERLIEAGINDWGGVSPLTPDHVNPEAAWPALDDLARRTERMGKRLEQRLPIYPEFAADPQRWLSPNIRAKVQRRVDARGGPRDSDWRAGSAAGTPEDFSFGFPTIDAPGIAPVRALVARCRKGERLSTGEIDELFDVGGNGLSYVLEAANSLRAETVGEVVRYVVNRNINYTNLCTLKCGFCAFSKGRASAGLRGTPYDLSGEEIRRRVREAWARGATEVCMQGGIHPDYDGTTYLDILRNVRMAEPRMHIHAFSPLEVSHGATSLGISTAEFLQELKNAGLGSLPGTAAEILDDEVRRHICPDKLTTNQWLSIVREAHSCGLRTTSTMMFGHVERPVHWARHLLALRDLQQETGGFTEFVPLPYVAAEAPMYLRGQSRAGPTPREAVLVHAVARLVLHPGIPNIQTSWTKLGKTGAAACLAAGANDLGGTLMNESISRAAGAQHGQEMAPQDMDALIRSAGRVPQQRTTLYAAVMPEREQAARCAGPLENMVQTPVRLSRRKAPKVVDHLQGAPHA